MLFDFYQKQNAKKPSSVHATYLVAGKQRTLEDTNGTSGSNGADVSMRSSPFMSSMPEAEEEDDNESDEDEPVKETTILLVREEELQSALGLGSWEAALIFRSYTRRIRRNHVHPHIQPGAESN
jgi:hypothetical protein